MEVERELGSEVERAPDPHPYNEWRPDVDWCRDCKASRAARWHVARRETAAEAPDLREHGT